MLLVVFFITPFSDLHGVVMIMNNVVSGAVFIISLLNIHNRTISVIAV